MEIIFQCAPLMATVRFEPFISAGADNIWVVVRFTFIKAHADLALPQINTVIDVVHHFMLNTYELMDGTYRLQQPFCNKDIYQQQIGSHEYGHTYACFCLQACDPSACVKVKHESAVVRRVYVRELARKSNVEPPVM